jgi:uncharacterized protein (DUF58 family)
MRLSLPINWHRFSLQRFLRGEGPETGPITLVQRRVYILPSRQGLFFAGLMLVMLLGSINYNNSLGYALTFLLAGLSIVAILHTYRNLLHLRLDVGHITPAFCGEVLRVPVLLDNSHHAARYAVQLGFMQARAINLDVPADHWSRAELALPARRRGRHPLPRFTLHTTFPLGLFRAWAHAQPDAHYLVYPAPDPQHGLPNEADYPLNFTGDRGHGTDDFAGLRGYHAGDSLRHVHWKTAARGQGLHTKQFGGDRAEELWLDWEMLPALDTESRLSHLTRWVLDAETNQLSYGLRLPGLSIPPAQGAAHRHRCLEALALYPHHLAEAGGEQP